VEKYCRAGQATDDDMAHAHCMLGTTGKAADTNTHTTIIFDICCFSTATGTADGDTVVKVLCYK
jgi:hypothetical protein